MADLLIGGQRHLHLEVLEVRPARCGHQCLGLYPVAIRGHRVDLIGDAPETRIRVYGLIVQEAVVSIDDRGTPPEDLQRRIGVVGPGLALLWPLDRPRDGHGQRTDIDRTKATLCSQHPSDPCRRHLYVDARTETTIQKAIVL